jgi:hypothetical protein
LILFMFCICGTGVRSGTPRRSGEWYWLLIAALPCSVWVRQWVLLFAVWQKGILNANVNE